MAAALGCGQGEGACGGQGSGQQQQSEPVSLGGNDDVDGMVHM